MRYGIIADIHSNLEAWETTMAYLNNEGIENYLCLGDIVGYGPFPNECVEIVRSLNNCISIAGNHEWGSTGLLNLDNFTPWAKESIIWTQKQLKEENKNFLRELPYCYTLENITLVHGSPRDPLEEYLNSLKKFAENLNYLKTSLYFVGHTHKPLYFVYTKEGIRQENHLYEGEKVVLNKGSRYIFNPGSVGQPRDRNTGSSLLIYDTDKQEIQLKRVPYAVNKTQEAMSKAGIADFLINRLVKGE